MSEHSAIESNLGYYYQGFYSLILLLNSSDESKITLETDDDVCLQQNDKQSLYQLKHRSKEIKKLNIKSVDFWKTILIWSKINNIKNTKFILVTCDYIDKNNDLEELTKDIRDISNLNNQLFKEAIRVINERDEYERKLDLGQIKKQNNPPFENRIAGCKAFIDMDNAKRECLLNNVYILHSQFNIFNIESEIENIICVTIPKEIRKKVVEELIEWWSYRVVKSMMSSDFKDIFKNEVQNKLSSIISELKTESFYINNLNIKPSISEYEGHRSKSTNMLKQIDYVDGGDARKDKALINSWKARTQRDKWLEDDISRASELEEYDESLIEEWNYKFEIVKEECFKKNLGEIEKRLKGLELYDWTYKGAKNEIDIMHKNLLYQCIVHGTYQTLSNQLRVGWHPDYKEILGDEKKHAND